MKDYQIKSGDILEIYVDGACRGNPGPSASSFIFVKIKKVIHEKSEYIGNATNNIAEYTAILKALKEAEKFTRGEIKLYSDSQLAIKQINKEWRITKPYLSDLCNKIYKQREKFVKVEFFKVGRNNSFIQKCDLLGNKCLDEKGFKKNRNL